MTRRRQDEDDTGQRPGPVSLREQLTDIARRARVPIARVIEEHAERSAIREYLGGMPREEAEARAVDDTCDVLGVSSSRQSEVPR